MIHMITAAGLSATPGMLCLEKDFVLCPRLEELPHNADVFQSEMLMLFYCLKGHLSMSVGDVPLRLSAGDAFLCHPLTTLHRMSGAEGARISVLFFSPQVADHLLPAHNNLAEMPGSNALSIVHFGEKIMAERIAPLLDLLYQRALNTRLPFRSNTLFHLFALLLFEVLNHSGGYGAELSPANDARQTASRADALFNTFIKLLKEDGGCHRTVNHYADLLCITPKHLSKVVKQKTGLRTLEVINRHAIQLVKLDLMLTDFPISQLAHKYGFNNFSFFCQYVKSHLGITPQEYRERKNTPPSADGGN